MEPRVTHTNPFVGDCVDSCVARNARTSKTGGRSTHDRRTHHDRRRTYRQGSQIAQIDPPLLPDVDWADDYDQRTNPALFTQLLRQAVPALDAVQWRVVETGIGYAQSVLPLIATITGSPLSLMTTWPLDGSAASTRRT
jgi:hypothetical protein